MNDVKIEISGFTVPHPLGWVKCISEEPVLVKRVSSESLGAQSVVDVLVISQLSDLADE